ncbi:hypothetical protein PT285_08225 [Lactobacillus sp. ESL0791]|uniref:hypothetical protein n=1 Tax=Lactobacillus sp. ESL0791 TaxID=2983234 RepID=UPI0023F663F5|nr:hypothetical protein [Lactobacillus sp. ESL0791]MDF7639383.1 hypothetical protein [Lactobacillus sp. ESL0791]
MKKKLLTILTCLALSIAGMTTLGIKNSQPVEAKTGDKYGIVKPFVLPKSWRGNWYDATGAASKIWKSGYNKPENSIWVMGKVKGTNKYPWQMSKKWKNQKNPVASNKKLFTHYTRGTWKRMKGVKWAVVTWALNKKFTKKNSTAFACHYEKLNGKRHKVLFWANGKGKVVGQRFKDVNLAQKYGKYHFKDMSY